MHVLVIAAADYSIPLAAFIVSAAALVYGVFGTGRFNRLSTMEQALNDRVADLTQQVNGLREENKECARRCRDLERENIELLRKVARMENGH